MENVKKDFEGLLKNTPDTARSIWSINTSKAVYEHLKSINNQHGRIAFTTRIDGIIETLESFLHVVSETLSDVSDKTQEYEPMIWGSTALILAQAYERRTTHEKVIFMLEDLTISTALPSSPITGCQPNFIDCCVRRLFAELAIGLLQLALILQKYPQAPEKKQPKFVEFEEGHCKTIQRLKVWAERLKGLNSNAASTSQSVTRPIRLSSDQIPISVNEHFLGREDELSTLRHKLESSTESPSVVSIHGLPGIGKTELAAQYCKRYKDKYDSYLWVTSDNKAKIIDALSGYTTMMQLSGNSVENEPLKNVQILLTWLRSTDVKWLIIFDNLDDPSQLNEFWPSGGNGHVIITTRSHTTAECWSTETLQLAPLSPTCCKELFYNISGKHKIKQHSKQMDTVMDEWEGVPLALNHIGSYISSRCLTIERFLKIYHDYAYEIYRSKYGKRVYPHSIATAFSVSEVEGSNKFLLQSLCFLDPDRIPTDILLSDPNVGQASTKVTSAYELYEAIASLSEGGLVTQTDEHITIHRFVQRVTLTGMSSEERISMFDHTLSLLYQKFPREIAGKPMWENWVQCNAYVPHVQFLCQRYNELFKDSRKNVQLADLLSSCTWYLVERGLFSEAEPLILIAQAVCPDHEQASLTLATVLFNLAGVRFECNRIDEALELCKKVLTIREQMLQPNDPLLGNTLYSIGIVYMEAGDLEESLRLHLRAVEIHEYCQANSEHDGSPTAMAYLDLGLCYWRMKKLDLASSYIEKGLAIHDQTTGRSSLKYGQGLYYLAQVRESQGRFKDAKDAAEESLRISQMETPNEFKTGLGLHKVATFYHREGNLEKALDCLERALVILERSFDPNPRVARSMFKMSEILTDMGKHAEAAIKRDGAEKLRSTVKTFPYNPCVTADAFDTLVPSFLA
ncbi:hypothetical protein NXS19_008327 [Fusarium pseudograminearum]|uniref:Uncharacterized protein n=1 Tax=Fusarium pseudograminearum (strain CS3096) TaxID=1028729 RepID=K3W1G5_FUSPC|nr:hypothetical protein FPSE_04040 [Fusarium pseudograminearum CS3096]EKJ75860.1 hypothetical protein FPSE_04040 [Fusarium pseudograminearum CS3096]UZP40511.1 hypothetical protein NXS19_008327 [Fusarium pseudograminearum]